jgi:hypothetical protein
MKALKEMIVLNGHFQDEIDALKGAAARQHYG